MTSLRRTLSLVFLRRGCRHRTALWMNRGSFWFTPFSISFICSRMSARKCRVLIRAHHFEVREEGSQNSNPLSSICTLRYLAMS